KSAGSLRILCFYLLAPLRVAGQADPDGDTDVNRVYLSRVHFAPTESVLSPVSQRNLVLRCVRPFSHSPLRLCEAAGRRDKAAYAHGSDILPDVERLQPDAIRTDHEDGFDDARGLLFSDLGYAIVGRRRDAMGIL